MTPRRGFTVTELLAAMAIVGLLGVVVTPSFQRYRLKARRGEALQKTAQLKGALNTFYAQYRQFAPCFGSMGIDWDGGWYGIGQGAMYNDLLVPKLPERARAKSAYCPDATSQALTLNEHAFPPNRYMSGCSVYSTGAVGHLSAVADDNFYVNIMGFVRSRCVGVQATDKNLVLESFSVAGTGRDGLTIDGPFACGPIDCNTTVRVD